MSVHPCAYLWGGPRMESCQILSYSVDGVVLVLLCLLDMAVLKSLPFLGMMPCVGDDQGLACGFSGSFLLLE